MMAMQLVVDGKLLNLTVDLLAAHAMPVLLGRVLYGGWTADTPLETVTTRDDELWLVVGGQGERATDTMEIQVLKMREEDNPAIPIHWRTQYGDPIRLAGGRFT